MNTYAECHEHLVLTFLAYLWRIGVCLSIRLDHGSADAGEPPGGDGLVEVRARLEPDEERVQRRSPAVRPKSGLPEDKVRLTETRYACGLVKAVYSVSL